MILRFEARLVRNTLIELGKQNPTGAFVVGVSTLGALSLVVLGNAILMEGVLSNLQGDRMQFFASYLDIYSLLSLAAGIVAGAYSLRRGHLARPDFLSAPIQPALLLLGQFLPLLLLGIGALWVVAAGAFLGSVVSGTLGWLTIINSWTMMMTTGWLGVIVYVWSVQVTARLPGRIRSARWLPAMASVASCVLLIAWNASAVSVGEVVVLAEASLIKSFALNMFLSVALVGGWLVLSRVLRTFADTPVLEPLVHWRIQGSTVTKTIFKWAAIQLLRDRGAARFVHIFVVLVGCGMAGVWYSLRLAYPVAGWGMLYISQFITCTIALAAFGHDARVSWIWRSAPIRFGHVVAGKALGYGTWSLILYLFLVVLDVGMEGWSGRHVNVAMAAMSTTLLSFFVGSVHPVNLDEPASVSPAMLIVVFAFALMALVGRLALGEWAMVLPAVLTLVLLATRLRMQRWPLLVSGVEYEEVKP